MTAYKWWCHFFHPNKGEISSFPYNGAVFCHQLNFRVFLSARLKGGDKQTQSPQISIQQQNGDKL